MRDLELRCWVQRPEIWCSLESVANKYRGVEDEETGVGSSTPQAHQEINTSPTLGHLSGSTRDDSERNFYAWMRTHSEQPRISEQSPRGETWGRASEWSKDVTSVSG